MTVRVLLVTLALLVAAPAAAQAQKIKPCPRDGRTVVAQKDRKGKPQVRLFMRRGRLLGCSTYYPSYGRVVRLGRKRPRLAAVDGANAIWTVRRGGADRVTTAELFEGGRGLAGRRAVPRATADGTRADARIDALRINGDGVFAWITDAGQLAIGGTTLAEAPAVTAPDGTQRQTFDDDDVALADTLPDLSAAARRGLVRTLGFDAGDSEGDECGGTTSWTWIWAAPAGKTTATAFVDWINPSC